MVAVTQSPVLGCVVEIAGGNIQAARAEARRRNGWFHWRGDSVVRLIHHIGAIGHTIQIPLAARDVVAFVLA